MASGATVKLGVEGISQFKTNMTQAKQAVKTLDAQLTLTEKTFKQTGDAESYMTEKAELLKAKLEQQKTILANAEKALQDMQSKGIDRASKAYQDMYRQMVNAKAAMIDTQTQIDNVGVASETTSEDVKGMNTELANVGKGIGWQNVTSAFDKITSGVEKAAKKVFNFGKQVVNTMLDAGNWADDLQTRADYFMMSPEDLQRAEKTARLIDTSVDSIVGSQRKLKKALGKQDEEAFGALVELMGEGYDPSGKSWEDVFWDAGEALMRFTNEEEQEVYAQRLFGKSWNELIPLFKAGRKEYEEMNASWSVVSKESIDALQGMQDEYDKLMANWETFKYEALAQFATPMKQALEIVNDQLGKVQEWLKSEEGQEFVEGVLKAITDGMKWIVDHKEEVVDALKWIVGGWAMIELTGGALSILQLINGVKNLHLFGGGGGDTVTNGGGSDKVYTGGKFTGTAAGLKLSNFMANAQLWSSTTGGPFMDWFLNQTNTGRGLRDGGGLAGMWEGLKLDVTEKADEIKNNLETLDSNWNANSSDANALAKLGKNNILFWNDQLKMWQTMDAAATGDHGDYVAPDLPKSQPTDNWEFDDSWSIDEQMEWVRAHSAAAEKMEEAAAELTGESDANRQSSSEMTAAAGQLKGLPGVIEGAIMSGMSGIKIYIDGQQAGNVLTPYVNSGMAGILAGLTK